MIFGRPSSRNELAALLVLFFPRQISGNGTKAKDYACNGKIKSRFLSYGFYDTCHGDSGGPLFEVVQDLVSPREKEVNFDLVDLILS